MRAMRAIESMSWTEFGQGITRQQVENVLQFPAVAVYFDRKPVAVLLSIEEYQLLAKEVEPS